MLKDRGDGQIITATSSGVKTKPNEKWTNGVIASRGLGDTIAKITQAVGITPCGGCKKRQSLLNKMFPYKR